MAKALDENRFDGEGRRLGERSGLDTRNFREISVQASKFRSEKLHLLAVRKDNGNLLAKYPSSPSSKRCGQGVAYSS